MTDRELLELAAKAAGIHWEFHWFPDAKTKLQTSAFFVDGRIWDPLADDGDALRLAVRLRIDCGYATMDCEHEFATASHPDVDGEVLELIETDESAATRRAIVRAAADIGSAS